MADQPKLEAWHYDEQSDDPDLQERRRQQAIRSAHNNAGKSMAKDAKDNAETKEDAEWIRRNSVMYGDNTVFWSIYVLIKDYFRFNSHSTSVNGQMSTKNRVAFFLCVALLIALAVGATILFSNSI